jgi:predicted MPP superfamily phosphohydrolase
MLWTRRRFLQTSAAAAASAALGVGAYTWRIEPHWVETVRRRLVLPELPAALRGATLMQLSDLHVGPRVDEAYLAGALRNAAALRPDLVVLTGDFISYGAEFDWAAVPRVLGHLPRGRLATLAILGNHDYGIAWSQPEIADRVVAELGHAGVRVLRNEVADVAGLPVVGFDDLWGPNFDPATALRPLSADTAALMLCHNPDGVDHPALARARGWVLAGHTHGGQCRPPFLPPPILPVRNRRYTAGAFAVGPGRTLYINRALGHSIQVRFNVRPEVTLFTLADGPTA